MALRLEAQRDLELEHARIALLLIDQGKEMPSVDRLAWIARRIEAGVEGAAEDRSARSRLGESLMTIAEVYYVPRSQVWQGSRGRASGRIHLHVDGRAICGRRRGWYERPPVAGEERCARCVASAARRGIAWPS